MGRYWKEVFKGVQGSKEYFKGSINLYNTTKVGKWEFIIELVLFNCTITQIPQFQPKEASQKLDFWQNAHLPTFEKWIPGDRIKRSRKIIFSLLWFKTLQSNILKLSSVKKKREFKLNFLTFESCSPWSKVK